MDQPGIHNTPVSLKTAFQDALRYWEPRRVLYTLVLTAVTLAWLILTWPHFRPAVNLDSLIKLMVLGLIANIPYCAAYLFDIPFQLSPSRALWLRRRWILWTIGTLLMMLLTCYWIADEIYPYVG